jgi:hypothetical protein
MHHRGKDGIATIRNRKSSVEPHLQTPSKNKDQQNAAAQEKQEV